MANKKIVFDIGFNVDKASMSATTGQLRDMMLKLKMDKLDIGVELNDSDKKEIIAESQKLVKAIEGSFNSTLGTLNVSKFQESLSKIDTSKVSRGFKSIGDAGKGAFRDVMASVLTTNNEMKQSNKILNDMAQTFSNTIKWGISSSIMNSFTGSIQKAYSYVKALDSSLNDIRIVSGESAAEMERFAKHANAAAGSMGASTLDYTNAALIYYQQGKR